MNLSVRIEEPASAASLARRSPELALMGAVLQDAIRSFCESSGSRGVRTRKLFDETSQWFASPELDWPFAFESICAALGIEPGWIRRLLREWLDGRGSKQDRIVPVPRLHLASRRRPLASLTSVRKAPQRIRWHGLREAQVS